MDREAPSEGGCNTPAIPRMQGANRRCGGEALRQGRIGESPRDVGWPRAWTLRTGEPSRTQDLSALMRQVLGAHVLQEARVSAQALNAATHERVKREVSSDSSLRRLAPQWSRRTLSEGCSTPATPRMQGANRRSSGEALRQGRIGESPRNVGWPRTALTSWPES